MRNKKGQSTLEYILLVTAVVIILIAFVAGPASPFKKAVNTTLWTGVNTLNSMSNKILSGK
jgi:uncharacterized protein (UPF0333 family)